MRRLRIIASRARRNAGGGWMAVVAPLAMAAAIVSCSHAVDHSGPGGDGAGPICVGGRGGTAGARGTAGAGGSARNACTGTPSRMPGGDNAGMGAATAPDGRIYLVFAVGPDPCDGAPLYVYDPTRDAYTQLASAPLKFFTNRLSVAFVAGKLVVLDFTLWVYDPATDAWTQGAQPPAPSHRAVVAGADGRAYFFGGYVNGVATESADAYDPATNSWSSLPEMPAAIGDPGAARVGGLMYVGGPTLAAFDPATSDWTTLAAPPTKRENPAMTDDGAGHLMLIGGTDAYATQLLDAVESFDPATGAWSTRARLPIPAQGMAAVTACSGRVFAFGGRTLSTFTFYDQVSVYGPGDAWTISP